MNLDWAAIAVIPSVFLLGPLALLAALFPVFFGGLAIFLRRWKAALTVICCNSTWLFLHVFFGGYARGSWWGTRLALWLAIVMTTVAGWVWSARRYRTILYEENPLDSSPRRGESIVLFSASLIGIAFVAAWSLSFTPLRLNLSPLLSSLWKQQLFSLWAGAWAATAYVLYTWRAANRQTVRALPTELVFLAAVTTTCIHFGVLSGLDSGSKTASIPPSIAERKTGVYLEKVVWQFDLSNGTIYSAPLVVGNRLYVGAIHGAGITNYGVFYCFDRDTGEEVWRFDADRQLKQVFSSPCLADGRLYFGEGLHENRQCNLYCLDASTGKEMWRFPTQSHTESSPTVAGGKVFFGAGDDGLYCCDAKTGKKLWQFEANAHIDSNPLVVNNRVYVGSGMSRTFQNTAMFCLDADTGKALWQKRTDLPVWSSPVAFGEQVFFGLGWGRVNVSEEVGAGAIICLDAGSGKELWRQNLGGSVMGEPAVDNDYLYCGSRDNKVYALDRRTGKIIWQKDMGSQVLAGLRLVPICPDWQAVLDDSIPGISAPTRSLFAVATGGRLACLDPQSGKIAWEYELGKDTGMQRELISRPAVIVRRDQNAERRRIFLCGELRDSVVGTVARCVCLEDIVVLGDR